MEVCVDCVQSAINAENGGMWIFLLLYVKADLHYNGHIFCGYISGPAHDKSHFMFANIFSHGILTVL